MGRKRNIIEINEESSNKKFKKLKNDASATKKEKKHVNNEKQNSGLETNSVKKQMQEKHGLRISIGRNISYKHDQKFFELLKDSKDITLGRNIFVTFWSEKEAKLNLMKLSKTSYKGALLNVSTADGKQQPKKFLFSEKTPRLILTNVPLAATATVVKEHFSKSIKIKRMKKTNGKFKSFLIYYGDKSEAEEDLNESQNLEIEGEKVKTVMPNNSKDKLGKSGASIPSSPTVHKKGQSKNSVEENTSSEEIKDAKKKHKKKKSKKADAE